MPVLSRRTLLAGTAGLAAAPLVGAQAADAPRKGGTLRLGLAGGSTSDTLDFTLTTDSVGVSVNFALWSAIDRERAGQQADRRNSAESWEAKPGAVEWVFNLRKGVRFTNGHTSSPPTTRSIR